MVYMKTIMSLIVGVCLVVFATGCAGVMKLPSVTIGGDANKHQLVGLNVSKDGIGVVAPLVAVDIPCPKVKLGAKASN